jgi:hypothetical protein
MNWVLSGLGQRIAAYLERAEHGYEPFTPSNPDALRATLRPGDVLLVEGNNRISGVIKYLTQSTWSHAALYVGPIGERETADGEPLVLVEAMLGQGVIGAPLSKYGQFHTRICRPIGLTSDDCARVCTYAAERIGFDYDVKNIFDLMRYLFPMPVPQRWRRRMMALGSGHPTRIICSALIAQAFEHVRYPILPKITRLPSRTARLDLLEIRHSSLYAPRDFDISPYFQLVKPTIEHGFDYRRLAWAHLPDTHEPAPTAPDEGDIGERSDADLRTAMGERSDADLRTAMGERSDADLRTAMGERSDAVLRTAIGERSDAVLRTAMPEDVAAASH